jgi:hypothetical protein
MRCVRARFIRALGRWNVDIYMKRLLQALVGGLVVTFLLTLLLSTVLTLTSEAVWRTFSYLLNWPNLFLDPFYPAAYSEDPSAALTRRMLMGAVLTCDVLLYSALTYLVLKLRDRRLRLS